MSKKMITRPSRASLVTEKGRVTRKNGFPVFDCYCRSIFPTGWTHGESWQTENPKDSGVWIRRKSDGLEVKVRVTLSVEDHKTISELEYLLEGI